MSSFAITNATVILPDQIVDGGAVTVRDGEIAEVAPAASALRHRPAHEIDAAGAYLLPGLVELHNDGYEFELNPRPGANIPPPLAFSSFERRLVSAGVTTEFHAISFMNRASTGRSVNAANGASSQFNCRRPMLPARWWWSSSESSRTKFAYRPRTTDTYRDSTAGRATGGASIPVGRRASRNRPRYFRTSSCGAWSGKCGAL